MSSTCSSFIRAFRSSSSIVGVVVGTVDLKVGVVVSRDDQVDGVVVGRIYEVVVEVIKVVVGSTYLSTPTRGWTGWAA